MDTNLYSEMIIYCYIICTSQNCIFFIPKSQLRGKKTRQNCIFISKKTLQQHFKFFYQKVIRLYYYPKSYVSMYLHKIYVKYIYLCVNAYMCLYIYIVTRNVQIQVMHTFLPHINMYKYKMYMCIPNYFDSRKKKRKWNLTTPGSSYFYFRFDKITLISVL